MTAAARQAWGRMHERTGDAGPTWRRSGVSRPTLGKRWRRRVAAGVAGLADRSGRPPTPSGRRVSEAEERRISELRRDRRLGVKRLRNGLIRLHGLRLSIDTIRKVLRRHGCERLERPRRVRKGRRRDSRPIPGDGVQMDVRRIGPRLHPWAAIDDGAR